MFTIDDWILRGYSSLTNAIFLFVRWNQHIPGQIAIGCSNGIVFWYNHVSKKQKLLQVADRTMPVVDIQWDRLSSIYLLIAYTTFISLWDADAGSEIHVFDKQSVAITSIAWLDWTAGNFVSTNGKNNVLKVWNASQKQPLDSIKVGEGGGINSIFFCPLKQRSVAASLDGTVTVYNWQRSQLEFTTSAGHTETIFDCKFSPKSPNIFCTASYDGLLKIWRLSDMRLEKTLVGSNDIIYCCEWSKNANMIAAVNSLGFLIIWDVETGQELARYLHHKKPSYSVAWNKVSGEHICTTSSDGTVVVIHVIEQALYDAKNDNVALGSRRKDNSATVAKSIVVYKYDHGAPVYGCAWCPDRPSMLSTCCQDGFVRVFNILFPHNQLIYLLQGHTTRSFSCCWSPLVPGLLATGSDDTAILLWQVDVDIELKPSEMYPIPKTPKSKFLGHKSYVRALSWSYEHKDLLLSGSWDASIRLWDTNSGICLCVVNDHVADVYSLTSHPDRPFTYISSSRDTTVRVWEMDGLFSRMRMQAVWDGCLDRLIEGEVVANALISVKEGMRRTSSVVDKSIGLLLPVLDGKVSHHLNQNIFKPIEREFAAKPNEMREVEGKESIAPVKKFERNTVKDRLQLAKNFYRIYNFFRGGSGVLDVWENAIQLIMLTDYGSSKIGAEAHDLVASPRAKTDSKLLKKPSSFLGSMMTPAVLLRPSAMRLIISEDEILNAAKALARKLEATKSKTVARRGDHSQKYEEQMRNSALMFARVGDFAKYCAIMIELNDWTAALAMAPSVSIDYWKQLCFKYAEHLSSQSSENCVPYLVGVGKDADAVDFYLRRNDHHNAMIIAKMSEQRQDLIPSTTASLHVGVVAHTERDSALSAGLGDGAGNGAFGTEAASPASPKLLKTVSLSNIDLGSNSGAWDELLDKDAVARERTTQENLQSRLIVKIVATHAAATALDCGNVFLAAAEYLSVQDVKSAIATLAANDEHDMAYSLAVCFDKDVKTHLINLADKCACLGDVEVAVDMLLSTTTGESSSNAAEIEIGLLLSKYCSESVSHKVLVENKLHPLQWWLARGKEEEQIGSDAEAITAFIIGRNFSKAANMAMVRMKKNLKDALELNAANKKIIRIAQFIRATELEENERLRFLCYILWYSAHEAVLVGLWDIGVQMLEVLQENAGKVSFPISEEELHCQQLFFMIYSGDRRALELLKTLLHSEKYRSLPESLTESLKRISIPMQAYAAHNKAEERTKGSSIVTLLRGVDAAIHEDLWGSATGDILK